MTTPDDIDICLLNLLQMKLVKAKIDGKWLTGKDALAYPIKKITADDVQFDLTEEGVAHANSI